MALTLLEANKHNDGDIKKQAIIQMFAENSDLLRVMPIEHIEGASLTYDLEAKLPGVGFRGINEAFNASTGVINPQTELLRIVGGDLDVDLALIKMRGIAVRDTQEAMKVKSLALTITGKIINGDSLNDAREFDGFRKRVGGSQLIEATQTAGTNGPLSLFQLDEATDKVDGVSHIIMSKTMRNLLNASARAQNGGVVEWSLDEFGRRLATYNGYPILIVDVDETDTKIIDFNEAGPAGGTVSTSIYIVAFGDDKVMGIENGGIDVRDLGELDVQSIMRTRVEWLFGLAVQHGRSLARIWGITQAVPTA